MKTKLKVHMVARVEVELDVEHEEGVSPVSLTDEEIVRAQYLAGLEVLSLNDWDVERVTRG